MSMSAKQCDDECYRQFWSKREDRLDRLPISGKDLRFLKPNDVFQEGDKIWRTDTSAYYGDNYGSWADVPQDWWGRTLGRRSMSSTPVGAVKRFAMQLCGEPVNYRQNENASERMVFEGLDVNRQKWTWSLRPDFRWLVCGERLRPGDLLLEEKTNAWMQVTDKHFLCGKPVTVQLLTVFPQGCIFREEYDTAKPLLFMPASAPVGDGYLMSASVQSSAVPAMSTVAPVRGVYEQFRAGRGIDDRYRLQMQPWTANDYYGYYDGRDPKAKSVNTYPQGLRRPSGACQHVWNTPAGILAGFEQCARCGLERKVLKPATNGERVKRVFNFDD